MISISPEEFRPLIEAAVQAALDKAVREDVMFQKRLAFTEGEAAMLLGVQRHVLRDERRRGRIKAKLIGKRNMYSVETLKQYLRDAKS